MVHVVRMSASRCTKNARTRGNHGPIAVRCGQPNPPVILHELGKDADGKLAHNCLAKVRVAGSNPVVRSTKNMLVRRLIRRLGNLNVAIWTQIPIPRGTGNIILRSGHVGTRA